MGQGFLQALIKMGVLKAELVENFKEEARSAGVSLVAYLLSKKIITQQDVAQAYSQDLSIPYVENITELMADAALLGKIQFHFLRQNNIIPVIINEKIVIISADPYKVQPIDELMLLLGRQVTQAVAPTSVVIDAINRYYPLEGTKQMMEELEEDSKLIEGELDLGSIDEQDVLSMASKTPVVKLVNHILFQAVKREASDIHIEPYEKEVRVRYRVDGVMFSALNPPKRIQSALISRIKIMANLNIAEKRKPQDGRIEIKAAGKEIDIRVSVLPVIYGERVVMRLLDKSKTFVKLETLGFSPRDFSVLEHAISQPNGIVLVSGPTGSGKTTTLYSILSRVNSPEVNLVTVEDPVEYQISGINQVQVNEKIGLTFAAALRSILRQDPDIIMIGEARDTETVQIAIQASLTGHLVFSTIHTNNAPATITRLIDMGIEPFLIASSVTAILAQRLVRRLCESCKRKYIPDQSSLTALGITPEQAQKITFYEAVGCPKCMNSGYAGRLPIFEIMQMTPGIAQLVVQRADSLKIKEQALKDGMTLLLHDGILKIEAGITTIEEVLSVASADFEAGEVID
ncbi:MAG: type II secretion system ATPase GspE [Candidatus Dependentiae bacterium]|nr:type II secretion system ATPase GspE [Candidatus Dependentiae bacterium]